MLEGLDLTRRLAKEEYRERYPRLQERLHDLQYALLQAEIPTVIVFEGWDAAGKGTTIRRLSERLDPRAFRTWPGTPPTELEQRYHFLWRYQVRLPEDGHVAVFDRSWYGRVLVDRVEKWASKKAWRAAYDEINQFERWLVDDGQVLVKLFLHISKDEQRRRLRAMKADPAERWKLSPGDWKRNRRYGRWLEAAEEMLARTDTAHAPWTVVEATDARWTRIKVFETLADRMQAALERRRSTPDEVSRTQAAAAATKGVRDEHRRESRRRAEEEAGDAGLPLHER